MLNVQSIVGTPFKDDNQMKEVYTQCLCIQICALSIWLRYDGGAAVVQWIRSRIPSCRPGFDSQAHLLHFFQFKLWCVEKTKINRKRGRDWPIFFKKSIWLRLCWKRAHFKKWIFWKLPLGETLYLHRLKDSSQLHDSSVSLHQGKIICNLMWPRDGVKDKIEASISTLKRLWFSGNNEVILHQVPLLSLPSSGWSKRQSRCSPLPVSKYFCVMNKKTQSFFSKN